MKILNQRYYGMIARCNNCGAILGYEPTDVNASQNIKCPQCGFTLWVPFNSTYDGVIKESEGKNDGNTVVSKQSGTGERDSKSQ